MKMLGVNYKTLAAALASEQLTPRLCDALGGGVEQ